MRSAWEYVIRTNDRLIAWFENNLYYHYVGYLVSVGNQPLDIYNRLSIAKQQRKTENGQMTIHKRVPQVDNGEMLQG